MKIELESRLPPALFSKAPFVYTSPDFSSFPLGMISSTLNYRGALLQRFHPLTVSATADGGRSIDQMFCIGFLYVNDDDDLVLFLSHPYWLDRSSVPDCLAFFLGNLVELARNVGSNWIKLEFHEPVISTVAFPTSLIDFSYDLDKMEIHMEDLDLFRRHGFVEEGSALCYEREIGASESDRNEPGASDRHVLRKVDTEEYVAIKSKVGEFPLRSYVLSNSDLIRDYRLIPSEVIAAYRSSRWFRSRSATGFVRWSPNLFEPLDRYHIPVPLLFSPALRDYRFKLGKVFEWAVREDDTGSFLSILSTALYNMRQRGLAKCQIDYVDSRQESVKTSLEQEGFRRVSVTRILAKGVG